MNKVLLLGLVGIVLSAGLSCSSKDTLDNLVNDADLESRLAWESMNASIAEGTVLLQSPDGIEPSQIRQKLTALKPNTRYQLSVTARAMNTPTAQLSVDLFLDDSYDSPDQELIIPILEIGPDYIPFHRVMDSGSFTEQPYLRIFTLSAVPIEVDAVALIKVDE